jgi:hypothetical protein
MLKSTHSSGWFTRRLRLALLVLVLVATGTQQVLAQTHWHAVPAGHAGIAAPADDSGANSHADCLLCRVASQAGAAAPPPALWLLAASHAFTPFVVAYYQADVPAVPGHAWQSRGPPAA